MCNMVYLLVEGSLEVKLPTIWTDEGQRWEMMGRVREEKRRRKKIKKEKVSVGKSRNIVFFE